MKLMEMSISAGVLILFLVLLRTISFSRLPKRLFVVLWMMAIARLLLPISLPIKSGIATPVLHFMQKTLCILKQDLFCVDNASVPHAVRSIVSAAPAGASKGHIWDMLMGDFSPALYAVWIAGAVGFGIYFLCSFRKEYQMLAQAIPLQSMQKKLYMQSIGGGWERLLISYKNAQILTGRKQQEKYSCHRKIYIHDRIQSPFVWGIFRQRIIFPKSLCHMEQAKIQYMLTHELIHMKRHDNLWKLLSAAVVCLHWFNPFVWIMYILLARDLELSCDEHVLALYGSACRKEYATTLLALIQNQMGRTLFCSGFGKNPAKERIGAIMKYKRMTKIGIFSAVLLLAGAATVFAANDQASASEAQPMQEEMAGGKDLEAAEASDTARKEKNNEVETVSAEDADISKPVLKNGESAFVTYTVNETAEDGKTIKQEEETEVPVEGDWAAMTLHIDNETKLVEGNVNYYIVDEEGRTYLCKEADSSEQPVNSTVTIDGKKYIVEFDDTVKGE